MNVIHNQLSLILLATLLANLTLADAIKPPPPPPPISNDVNNSKPSTVIETTDTNKGESNKQDKPEEQQQQYPAPDLVIRYKDGAKIEEYRVNGQLRYAKITPKIGPAYYLIDTDGDGRFDKRHNFLDNPPIQQWLLYSW